MESSVIAGWSDFLVAAAGAAAALAGLVFVAISINLAKIIELPGVASRAGETLTQLAGTLAGCLTALLPHLSARELSVGIALCALPTWILPTLIQVRSFRTHTYYRLVHSIVRSVLHQIATLPALLTVLALNGVLPGGLLWFGAGVVLSLLVGVFNAWVLLIEIVR